MYRGFILNTGYKLLERGDWLGAVDKGKGGGVLSLALITHVSVLFICPTR